ncbi:hypothetical protein MMC14_000207 [Varicellaria rhodocarpa]|nr:hypothetical protein [Varicellaria rhodocarpa]
MSYGHYPQTYSRTYNQHGRYGDCGGPGPGDPGYRGAQNNNHNIVECRRLHPDLVIGRHSRFRNEGVRCNRNPNGTYREPTGMRIGGRRRQPPYNGYDGYDAEWPGDDDWRNWDTGSSYCCEDGRHERFRGGYGAQGRGWVRR